MPDEGRPRSTVTILCWITLIGVSAGLITTMMRWNALSLKVDESGRLTFLQTVLSSWPLYLGSGLALAAVVTGVLGPARGRRTFLTALAGSIILWAGLVIDFVAHRRNENWLTGHLLWYAGIVLTNGSVFAVLLTSIPAEPDDEPDIDPARQGTD